MYFQKNDFERKTFLATTKAPIFEDLSRTTIDTLTVALKKITENNNDVRCMSKKLVANIDTLKYLTKSTDCYIHYMDEENRRISSNIDDVYVSSDETICQKFTGSLREYEHISEAVAKSKEPLLMNNMSEMNKIFPNGVQISNTFTTNLLCLPLMDQARTRCYIVVELNRENNKPYGQLELRLANTAAKWLAIGLGQKETKCNDERDYHLNMKLRSYVENYFLGKFDFLEFLSKILIFAKSIVNAEKVLFFKTYTRMNATSIHVDLYQDIMTPTGCKMVKQVEKYKLHREKGLASQVVRTGKPFRFTATDVDDVRFDAELIKTFGVHINNSILHPVKYQDTVIAVVELVNKQNDEIFTTYDEIILERICVYLALVQHYEKIKELCEFEQAKCEIIKSQFGYQITSLATVPVYAKFSDEDLPEGFNDFSWYLEKNEELAIPWMFYMFKKVCSDIVPNDDVFYEFLIDVKKCHRSLPFRNFLHSFDTTHTIYCIVLRIGNAISKLEALALMLAGCIQGVNSEGYNSQYYIATKHPITQVYEAPHFRNFQLSFSKRLISVYKLVSGHSQDDQNRFYRIISDCILNLSVAHGESCVIKLSKLIDEKKYNTANPQHRNYHLLLIMRAACKSRVAKPFRIAKRLCEDLYRELYSQGDFQKQLKLPLAPWMDRANVNTIPENEVEYIRKFCLPIYELLKRMHPSTGELLVLCRELLKAWELMIELRYKKAWNPDESIGKSLEDTTK